MAGLGTAAFMFLVPGELNVFVYVYVCMCVCVYVCMFLSMFLYMCMRMCVCVTHMAFHMQCVNPFQLRYFLLLCFYRSS